MGERLSFLLPDLEATSRFGMALGALLSPGDVLALEGEMGVGKTWLTRAVANGMGIRDEVTSPTFTLVQEYRGPIPMFHMDTYRLLNPEDLFDLGFEEYLERGGVTLIEWSDRLGSLLPANKLTLILSRLSDLEDAPRRLIAVAEGRRYKTLLKDLTSRQEIQSMRESGAT